MHHQYSFNEDPVGCGLVGCLGGLILGLFGGGILVVIAAFTAAVAAPMPTLNPSSAANPDLRVTVEEGFLNRFVDQPTDGMVRIDVLPGNQVQLLADTTIPGLGTEAPVQIMGLFELQLIQQNLQVQLIDTQVSGLTLPPNLTDFFSEDLLIINQDLGSVIDDMSQVLGTPIIVSRVSTTETQIQLEIREVQ